MKYTVKLTWDNVESVWIATSDDILGLVLESNSYDALIEKVKVAIPELLSIDPKVDNTKMVNFISERLESVA